MTQLGDAIAAIVVMLALVYLPIPLAFDRNDRALAVAAAAPQAGVADV
jgi:hypothetical protein